MKRILSFLLAGALLISSAVALAVEPENATLNVNAHLRADPSTQSDSKMILMKGTRVTVVDVVGRWLHVRYGNFTGYIRSDLIVSDAPIELLARITATPPTLGSEGNLNTLKKGMRSEEVRLIKESLRFLGFSAGAEGPIFDQEMKGAVIAFQETYGLKADGIVGAKTYKVLQEALQAYGE